MAVTQAPEDRLLAEQTRFAQARAAAPPAVRAVREAGAAQFARLGLPTTRLEAWRFTNLAPLAATPFALANGAGADDAAALAERVAVPGAVARLVVVNGRFSPALSIVASLPAGMRAGSLAAALTDPATGAAARLAAVPETDHAFIALNRAFLDDGVYIEVPAGVAVNGLIQVVHVAAAGDAPAMAHPAALVVAGRGSRVQLALTFVGVGDGSYLTNTVADVVLEPEAVVDLVTDQREAPGAFHVSALRASCGAGSVFHSRAFALGGRLVRNELTARLAGEGAHCTLDGFYLADEEQLVDNHTAIDHAVPRCTSHELYKGILDGRARAVFHGRIIVRPEAQKTDAKQTNRAILLSDDAQINSNPQLEIFADDVKCTHGAAVGQLDEEAMFYLQARGLPYREARDLLLHAFAGEVLAGVTAEPLRAAIEAALFERLERDLARHDAAEGRG